MIMRNLLFQGAFRLAAFLWATVILAMLIFPYEWRHYIGSYWADTTIWLARLIGGIHWQVHGLNNLPDEPCIFVLNHQSNWETFFTILLRRKQVWVVKKELTDMPWIGWGMRAMRPIAIDRSHPRAAIRSLIREGEARLTRGYSLVIYPEGTRSPVDEPQPFKVGAGGLAARLGVPVVPIAHNAGQFWPVRGRLHSGTVQVVIGQPITTHDKTPQEINAAAEAWISAERTRIVNAEKARRGETLLPC